MAEETGKKQVKFSDYIYVLYKWRKLLFINMFLIIAGATVYSFLITEQFKATSIVMVSSEDSFGLSGLSSLISGGSGSLGAKLFGKKGTSEDLIFGILNSKSLLTNAIHRFNMMEYYGIDDLNIDKAIKSFTSDLIFELNENGLIEISVINENPFKSAEISNYFVRIADSLNIELNVKQARNNRMFIEKRYYKNLSDLRLAEDSMYNFQKEFGIFAVPEQLEASVKAAAEIEAQLIQQELMVDLLKQQYGENSPRYIGMRKQLAILENKVYELKKASKLSYSSNVLFPFSEIPGLTLNYYRIFREIEIQTKVMEFVLPMYEQAKVEEQKSIPTLIVVDPAVPPTLKYSPKKAFIILLCFFLGLFIHLPIIFRMEGIHNLKMINNPLDEKENKFYSRLVKIYRIRF
ncbi:MAG: hypothetical protein IH949_05750 [Bacteroidetes bacterium]|nr:hypothetical protein [Bacteroidota bacterium]